MPSNIEIKFRVEDLNTVETKAAAIADRGPEIMLQEDIFFNVADGRLKLRKFVDGTAELIAYHRSDSNRIRESKWHAYATTNPDALQSALALTIGQSVTVRKHRTLYLVGQTRIHLDRVEDLGSFVELEVVLAQNDTNEAGFVIAQQLVEKLGLLSAEKVAFAYADLLSNNR